MKNAVIIGGGGHSLSMIDILLNSNEWNLIGYTDISNKGKIKNIPYIGNENKLNKAKCKNLFMGLSYLKTPLDRTLRFQIISELLNKGFVFPKLISQKSNLSKFIKIGQGTVVFKNATINIDTKLGDFGIINTSSVIDHECQIGNQFFLGPGSIVCGGVEIGNNVFIGAGSVINNSIKISSNVIIGMGSVVTKDIIQKGLYYGNPIKKID